jgi:hypothetical protein
MASDEPTLRKLPRRCHPPSVFTKDFYIMPTITQFTQLDAVSPLEWQQWMDEAATVVEPLDISNLLDLIEKEVQQEGVALAEATRMLAIATDAIAQANHRAAIYSEVF